jgi:hypothetical protein
VVVVSVPQVEARGRNHALRVLLAAQLRRFMHRHALLLLLLLLLPLS